MIIFPSIIRVVTWLNNYLKWRLKDGYIRTEKQKQQTVSVQVDRNNKIIDPIDNLPAKADIPPLLEEIEKWALTDPQNKLRRIYLENHPQVTSQVLILRRLPPVMGRGIAKFSISGDLGIIIITSIHTYLYIALRFTKFSE